MTPQPCLNCNAPLAEQFNYCPVCSQKTKLHRLGLHDIIHDAIHFFLHADKSIFTLVKDLAKRSGSVAKEFVEGKRKRHFPPLNFLLICAGLFVLMMSWTWSINESKTVLEAHPELLKMTGQKRVFMEALYGRQARALGFINRNANLIQMFGAPVYAFLYWLFYKRGKYNFSEHLVAVMYMNGFTSLFFALIIIPVSVMAGFTQAKPSVILTVGYFIATIAYHSWFYYRFFDERKPAKAWKAVAINVLTTVLWILLSGAFVMLYMLNKLPGISK